MNSLGSAIQHLRERLSLRQADLAQQLGCKQNTVSQYENGKLSPSSDILSKLWALADPVERHLLLAHFAEAFQFATREQLQDFTRLALGTTPIRTGLVEDLEELLNRPHDQDRPQRLMPLAEFVRLYRQFGEMTPQTHKLFEQAVGWLQIQLDLQRAPSSEIS